MDRGTADVERILDALEEVRAELADLRARVVHLEAASAPPASPPVEEPAPAAGATAPVDAPGLDPETVMSIAAAVAAYLGKSAPIRSIHLVGTDAWAQQGRATMQAWYSVSPSPSTRG